MSESAIDSSAPKEKRRFPVKWFIRVGVSSVVLGLTLWFLPTQEVWSTMRNLSPLVWLASLGCFLGGHVISAMKWRFLIQRAHPISKMGAIRAHFAGLVANLCLPGVAGGDVVRAGLVIRKAEDRAGVAIGSLADRLLDMFALLTLACAGAQMTVGAGDATVTLIQIALALSLVLGSAAVLAVVGPRLPLPSKLLGLVSKLASAIRGFAAAPMRPIGCFALSLLVQSTFVSVNVFLAKESGVDAPTAAWFLAWPLAKLLAVAPVSVAGLGVREASLAALLSQVGAEPAKVVAVGLLWQSILFTGGLLGGLLLLIFGRAKAPGQASSKLAKASSGG